MTCAHRPSQTEQFREHIARVFETGTTEGIDFMGRRIIVLTTRGATSGTERKVPLMRIELNGTYAAVASRGGAPQNPA